VFDKIASPTTSCIDEREMRERAVISYFLASFKFMSL
jgi:hypothetical protein